MLTHFCDVCGKEIKGNIMEVIFLIIGIVVGFVLGIISLYFRFDTGKLVIVDDGEEPYTYAEFSKPIEIVKKKKVIVLNVEKVNFIDHTR